MDIQHNIWTRINPSIKLLEELESPENEMEIIRFVGSFAYNIHETIQKFIRFFLPTILQLMKIITAKEKENQHT